MINGESKSEQVMNKNHDVILGHNHLEICAGNQTNTLKHKK